MNNQAHLSAWQKQEGSLPMNVDTFSQQVAAMHDRISSLIGHPNNENGNGSFHPPQIASALFKEIGVALEELQVAVEELHQQNDALSEALENVAEEQKHYLDLFNFAPEAYLVTNLEGTIREANRRSAQLLEIEKEFLVDKPLSLYVVEEDRSSFRSELTRRLQEDSFQEWEMCLKSREGQILHVACVVSAIRDRQGLPTGFRWAIRDISHRKRVELLEQKVDELSNLEFSDVMHSQSFQQEDVIPLDPHTCFYVKKGIVKLTTFTEHGHEVLLGLIYPGMPFGASFTSLSVYEAIALSDVELLTIPLREGVDSALLIELLFQKTGQRLQQTEALLAVLGERDLETRLWRLLQLLANAVGQSTAEGVCLGIRLTHQDLANACCTTRVTISHLLGKLQRKGILTFDKQRHIVLLKDMDDAIWNPINPPAV